MFNLDKIIEESHKRSVYGEKPELPKKLDITYRLGGNCETIINNKIMPEDQIEEIAETINKIIDYLEWQDK